MHAATAVIKAWMCTHMDAAQTQAFHTLYHTDENVLLGAPTGSGEVKSNSSVIGCCLAKSNAWIAWPP
eukprot:1159714-Pelagomonas_calceolata.AAC.7